MSRTPRKNVINSSFFHIMVQGINKEYIFNTKEEKETYLKLIYKNIENVNIIAYCIMDNHAHFLVQTEQINNLEGWMRKSNTSYAIYYNRKNQRVGYVFRNRYKIQVIKNPQHLYTCVQYIHDNPVKAKMVFNSNEYKFSSYSEMYQGSQIVVSNKIKEILENIKFDDNNKEEKLEFMEEENINKEEICQHIVNQFLIDNNICIQKLKKDKENLKKIVKILKNQNNISYRMMERYLEVNREKLRKILI